MLLVVVGTAPAAAVAWGNWRGSGGGAKGTKALTPRCAVDATSTTLYAAALATPARPDAPLRAPRILLHRILVVLCLARPTLELADAACWVLGDVTRSARCVRSVALGSFLTAAIVVRGPAVVSFVARVLGGVILVSFTASLIPLGPHGQAGGASPQARAAARLVVLQPAVADRCTSTSAFNCAATLSMAGSSAGGLAVGEARA